jgi:hypothetical protein
MPGDHAVAKRVLLVEAEVVRAMHGEGVQLHKRARVEQLIDALPCGLLAARLLLLGRSRVDCLGLLATAAEFFDFLLCCLHTNKLKGWNVGTLERYSPCAITLQRFNLQTFERLVGVAQV